MFEHTELSDKFTIHKPKAIGEWVICLMALWGQRTSGSIKKNMWSYKPCNHDNTQSAGHS